MRERREDYLVGLFMSLAASAALGLIALRLQGWRSVPISVSPLAPFVVVFWMRLRDLGRAERELR